MNTLVSTDHRGLGDRQYYEKWYADRSPVFYRAILSEIIAHGRPGSILDLGCGTGLFLSLAADWGLEAAGCEGAEDAIVLARQRDPRLQITRALFTEPLPLEAASVENALLNQVIEHLSAEVLPPLLREVHRVLKPGGMLFIFSPSRANRREIRADPTHIHPLLPSELRRVTESCGFTVTLQPDTSLFAGRHRLLHLGASLCMRVGGRDILSGTANIHARKL